VKERGWLVYRTGWLVVEGNVNYLFGPSGRVHEGEEREAASGGVPACLQCLP